MDLVRIYAYAVTPQGKAEVKLAPSGGAFPVNEDIRKALDALLVSSKLASQAEVRFRMDGTGNPRQRQYAVRDFVMDFASRLRPRRKLPHRLSQLGLLTLWMNARHRRRSSSSRSAVREHSVG